MIIRHKDQPYSGLHTAIIDADPWDTVQAKLIAGGTDPSGWRLSAKTPETTLRQIIAGETVPAPDEALQRTVAEARLWVRALRAGTSLTEIARETERSEPYIRTRGSGRESGRRPARGPVRSTLAS